MVAAVFPDGGWTKKGPNGPIYLDDKQPDGTIYRRDCPWRSLGVDPPRLAQASEDGVLLSRPSYQPSGVGACVSFVSQVYDKGHRIPEPATAVAEIDMVKKNGRWMASKVNLGFCIPNH